MNKQLVISVRARDRVGIIYEVANQIRAMGGDIADLRQSVLKAHFTMILLAHFPDDVTPKRVREMLSTPELRVGVNEVVAEPAAPPADNKRYILTASSRDRVGLVAEVAGFCAQRNLNILDLTTMRDDARYVMMFLVDLADAASFPAVRRDLDAFALEKGVQVTLQHEAIFEITHEVG